MRSAVDVELVSSGGDFVDHRCCSEFHQFKLLRSVIWFAPVVTRLLFHKNIAYIGRGAVLPTLQINQKNTEHGSSRPA
ncbi:MAG: hypothetical protein ACI9ND_001379 [Yoonia sp.]